MPDLTRRDVETQILNMLSNLAAKAGPEKHTIWEHSPRGCSETLGFMIYRATPNATPVVIWIDEDSDNLGISVICTVGDKLDFSRVTEITEESLAGIEAKLKAALGS